METYLSTSLSILVAVILFIIGYRQTIGARRERTRSANSELERVLLRRMVLESYIPTLDDISRLIKGKARDYRIKPRDVLSEAELIETLLTRVIESDFLSPEIRSKLIERINALSLKAEEEPIEEAQLVEVQTAKRQVYSRTLVPMLMGAFTAVIGTIVVTLPLVHEDSEAFTSTALIAFTASLLVVLSIFFALRLRESQEETISSKNALQTALDFEQEVLQVLSKVGVAVYMAPPSSGIDMVAKIGEKTVLIEVKAWRRQASIHMLHTIVDRLKEAIRSFNATEAIVITKAQVDIPKELIQDVPIRIMSLRDARNYFTHRG